MSTSHEDLTAKFLAEIEAAIEKHGNAYRWDAFWYQLTGILSAVCGLIARCRHCF